MSRSYSPEEPPVRAVRREADGAAKHQALSRLLQRPVREVRGGQYFSGGVGIGGHDEGCRAEAESHELCLVSAPGHGSQGSVSQAPAQGEYAPEDGKPTGPTDGGWASPVPPVLPCNAAGRKGPREKPKRHESQGQREQNAAVQKGLGAEKSW